MEVQQTKRLAEREGFYLGSLTILLITRNLPIKSRFQQQLQRVPRVYFSFNHVSRDSNICVCGTHGTHASFACSAAMSSGIDNQLYCMTFFQSEKERQLIGFLIDRRNL